MNDELTLTPEEAALLLRRMNFPLTEESPETLAVVARLAAHAKLVPPPLNGDKVWCGLTTRLANNGITHNQCKTVVRAKSMAEAVQMLNGAGEYISRRRFASWWSETGNREQLALATGHGVWVKGFGGWVKVRPKETV